MNENIGKVGKDKVTGFEGIITACVYYLYGCTQYGITPRLGKDKDKIGDTHYFDIGRVEIKASKGILPADVQVTGNPGGPNRDMPRR